MIGTIPENTKPSRVNRKRKRRWKISDLIKSGLTDCYAVAHNLTTAPHWAVEFCSSRTGVQSPLKRVVFLCQKFSTIIQSSEPFYYGVVRHGESFDSPHLFAVLLTLFNHAARCLAVIGGGYSILRTGSPL
jgi:hypothetical protein